jgi:hypothetical protein
MSNTASISAGEGDPSDWAKTVDSSQPHEDWDVPCRDVSAKRKKKFYSPLPA